MRLRLKYVYVEPLIGATRLKRVFAFKPTAVGNEKVWLEFYELLQGYVATKYKVVIDGEPKELVVKQWVTLSKRVID